MILIFFFVLGAVTADLNIVNPILSVVSPTSAPINPLNVVSSTQSQDFLTAILGKNILDDEIANLVEARDAWCESCLGVDMPVKRHIQRARDTPRLISIHASLIEESNNFSYRSFLEVASQLVGSLFPSPPIPRIPERWWGEKPADSSIRPFRVQFSDEMISDLRQRIQHRRNITRSLHGAAQTYGTNSDFLEWFLHYWTQEYDFQGRERWLNSLPQYLTIIQGLDIHYIHVKPSNPQGKKVLPLLLIHGWPMTAFEFIHVINYLQQERDECDFVFEIIAPSVPGFGYSEATNRIGLAPYEIAVILKNLMTRLGNPRFYIHCAGIAQPVGDALAVLFPDRVMGLHTNSAMSLRPQTLTKYALGQLYPAAVVDPRYQSRMYPISNQLQFILENFGYFHEHATRPDNLGHGLDDSPVALASWVLQSIVAAAAPENNRAIDGNAGRYYDMLDWFDCLTVYWATQTMTTSIRMYAEFAAWNQNPLSRTILLAPVKVPFAVVRFANELIYQPDDFVRDRYQQLVQSTTLDFGGHFVSYQEPAVLADHIWTSVTMMKAFNDVNVEYEGK